MRRCRRTIRLTPRAVVPTPHPRAEGWMAAGAGKLRRGEESPDSMKQRCRVMPGRGNPTESATENRPPASGLVRVKRWGKSPPRPWQQGRHGKPHREQCQIGSPRGQVPVRRKTAARFASAERDRVGSLSGAAMRRLDEWPSIPALRGRGDRIRLTGLLRVLLAHRRLPVHPNAASARRCTGFVQACSQWPVHRVLRTAGSARCRPCRKAVPQDWAQRRWRHSPAALLKPDLTQRRLASGNPDPEAAIRLLPVWNGFTASGNASCICCARASARTWPGPRRAAVR